MMLLSHESSIHTHMAPGSVRADANDVPKLLNFLALILVVALFVIAKYGGMEWSIA